MKRVLAVAVVALVAATAVALPAHAASDKEIAKAGVITSRDVPSSWDSTPADPSSDKELEAVASGFPECDDYLASRKLLKKGTNAASRDFTSPEGDLSNETWVFASTSAAKKAFRAMGASDNADCLTQVFQASVVEQLTSDPATASQVLDVRTQIQTTSSLPSTGDDQLGYAGTVEIDLTDGTTQQLLLAYFAIRTDRGILGYTIAAPTVDGTFSDSFVEPAEEAIVGTAKRMQKALD